MTSRTCNNLNKKWLPLPFKFRKLYKKRKMRIGSKKRIKKVPNGNR